MKYEILDSPDFAMLQLTLNKDDEVIAESGAMVAKDTGIEIETSMRGGLFSAAKRKLLGGESLFQNRFKSQRDGQRLYLAPPAEGDLQMQELAPGEEFFLQSGAYVAHYGDELQIDTKFGGVKGFFSSVGFFMLKIVGPGKVFYGSYGALHCVELTGESYTVDNSHIVGFTQGLDFKITKFGGYKGLFFSGEGLVARFSGQGKIWLQTRSTSSLTAFLHPFRRVKRQNN